MDLETLLDSLNEDELKFIAARDYGEKADVHLSELHKLIRDQRGTFSDAQYSYPYGPMSASGRNRSSRAVGA